MKKVFIVLGILVLVSWSAAFAADLEIVEEENVAPAIQEAAAVVGEVKTQVPAQEAKSEAVMVKAKDETIPVVAKKVMPLPTVVPQSGISEPTRYTLGPDDVIEIIVRRHPEFSDKFIINAEGKVQYKFVGDIEVRGLTKTEVKDKIIQVLSKFIISPDVEVTILDYRSKIIYVIGEVGAPGKYYMKADEISLREAVVQAGLPTLSASMRRTQLIRPDKSGKPKIKTIDLYALLYEGKLNLDQIMFPGDVLVVPATVFAKIMRVVSPITAPVASSDTLRRAATGGI
ncbi:MAG: polysaccharide export protein [Candidatus Omnitrophica bacterium]|nr:polysaccharide export protein [Candidatus Omnitrophota bacterium]